MYEYEFVRCPIQFARGHGVQTQSYRSVIEEYARKGWRLVQVLVQVPAAVPSEYELIFERPRVGARQDPEGQQT